MGIVSSEVIIFLTRDSQNIPIFLFFPFFYAKHDKFKTFSAFRQARFKTFRFKIAISISTILTSQHATLLCLDRPAKISPIIEYVVNQSLRNLITHWR